MMNESQLAERSDANYFETYCTVARVNGFPPEEFDGVLCTATGVPDASLNFAFVTRPPRDPGSAIGRAAEYFKGLGLPFVVRIREGIAPGAEQASEEFGLPYSDTVPGMALHPVSSVQTPPPELDIRLVRNPGDLQRFREVAAAGFGIPVEGAAMLLRDSILDERSIESYLGFVDGVPVATSTLVKVGNTAGVYNVATIDTHRKRGYGEAMTWRAVAGGVAARCDVAILQASQIGRPIYERMGFRLVAPYRTFHRPD